jgi:hypothetical protein
MANPVMTPYGGGGAAHSVSMSDVAYYDIEITDLSSDADLQITVPAVTVNVDVWRLAGGEPTPWNSAGVGVPLLSGGVWVSNATVGPWSFDVSPDPGDPTLPVLITINSGPAVGCFRLRVSNLAGAQVTLQALSNTRTARIVADPTIVTAVAASLPVLERAETTMLGNAQVSVQAGAVPAPLGGPPVLRGVWEKVSTDPTFTITQLPPFNAKFKVPGVYKDTDFTLRFRAYYDVNNDSAFQATEPETSQDVTVTFVAVHHRMVVVIDRSGSMGGTLPGGTISKWDASRRAAHIWLDLFAAFRPTSNQTAGFVTFEQSTGGYGTVTPANDVTLRNPQTGAAASPPLPALNTLAAVPGLNLGGPMTSTPIGSALKETFDILENPALGPIDAATIVLLTDGYENAGTFSIKNPPPAGTTFVCAALTPTLKSKLHLYVIGCGQSVDEGALNALPALCGLDASTSGYYRLAPKVSDLLTTFAEMIADTIDAADIDAVIDITKVFAIAHTNAGETKLAFVVPWDAPGDTLQLSRKKTGGSWQVMAFTNGPVPDPDAPGVLPIILFRRDLHAIMTIDLVKLKDTNEIIPPEADWKIEWLKAGNPQDLTQLGVLAVLDLHCKMEVEFDKNAYKLGEPISVTARINAGNEVVTGATVIAEVAGPGEGLGTFMSNNGAQLAGPVTFGAIKEGRLAEVLHAAGSGSDPNQPKGALFNAYLRLNGIDELPTVNPLFTDGTDRLFDDGAHGPTPANVGVYSNAMGKTDKEGTYTFRFRAEGTLSNGSTFRRVITVSKWVGVKVDPAASPLTMTAVQNPPAGMVGQLIVVMPKSKNGEFLGPFREDLVRIEATAGSFTGPVETRMDGSYQRTLLYRREEKPEIKVIVDDEEIEPAGADSKGCLAAIIARAKKLLGM